VLTTVEPTVPLPRSAAPLFTVVRLDDAIEPFTISAPASMAVPPEYVLAAVRMVVPGPICANVPVPEMTPLKV
jgi:hypothetical protein